MRAHVRFGQCPALASASLLLLLVAGCNGGSDEGGGGQASGGDNGQNQAGDTNGDPTGGANGANGGGSTRGTSGSNGGGTSSGTTGGMIPVDPVKCGNLVQDPGESCDDGNKLVGDGCTELCQVETGFNCPMFGVACDPCGDGILQELSEQCDDNNTADGDGCSASCKLEGQGFQCPIEGQPCEQCGNGMRDPNERCDDGNRVSGDGCAADCYLIEPDYSCPMAGVLCERCGNGIVRLDEACDDNNTMSDDGCTFNCKNEEAGYVCPASGGSCTRCGDKIIAAGLEQCDDGNIRAGDGCDARCQKESGSFCLGAGSLCFVCGNGFIEPVSVDTNGTATPDDDIYKLEDCDDGNKVDGDGCSSQCVQDPAYDCPVPGFGCNICGDGKRTGIEACDDNQTVPTSGDGCSSDCLTIEPYFDCSTVGTRCERCGDGLLDPNEQCDDGGRCSSGAKSGQLCRSATDCDGAPCAPYGGDGCSRTCDVEAGWFCAQNNDLTHKGCALCGNGKKELREACDDDNNVSNDGCSSDCTMVEPGYNCFFDGFSCAKCGDGIVDPGEKCDEGPSNKTAGCNAQCQIVSPWVCIEEGKPCELCGDGALGANYETCDDKNLVNDDGCSSTCDVEPGWVCGGLSCSAASCGDGFRAGTEECDDSNDLSGDGCSTSCDVEKGYVCGATGCRKTVCGDTVVEGEEACDDGKTCGEGTACKVDGDCVGKGDAKCLARSADGCSATCAIEAGFTCPDPGQPCKASVCGDGFVEGLEQCDKIGSCGDANSTRCIVAADCIGVGTGSCTLSMPSGCSASCTLVAQNACDPIDPVCHGGANEGDPCTSELSCGTGDCSALAGTCHPTVCNDGKVEGTEKCDDGDAPGVCRGGMSDGATCSSDADCTGGGACLDGCSSTCTVNPFYKCENEEGHPSICRPILELVSVRRFTVANISPTSLVFDPKRRSFIGYKSVASQAPVELCLDGTLIKEGVRYVCAGGSNDGEACASGADCNSTICGEVVMGSCDGGADAGAPCTQNNQCASSTCKSGWKAGPRPLSKYGDGAYDPFTGRTLFLDDNGKLTDLPVCDRYDASCPVDATGYASGVPIGGTVAQYQASLTGGASLRGATVGTDGDLYVTYSPSSGSPQIRVYKRRRNPDGSILMPACSTTPAGGSNCTTFEIDVNRSVNVSIGGSEDLTGVFTVPGEYMVGIFNGSTPAYTGFDVDLNATVSSSEYFTFFNTNLSTYGKSALPGLLFDLGNVGTSYTKFAQSAETAARGGAFVMCPNTPSEPCQLFARTCDTDEDCASVFPGTRCNVSARVPYCSAPGDAVDDRATVDAGKQDATLDVLSNDSFSESACADPHKRVLSLTVGTTTSTTSIATTRGGTVTIGNGGANVIYDAPDATKCGFIDTFQYTADLGGGVTDTATVRVVVACDCGDKIKQGSEQCDLGDAVNGQPGSRCSATCTINVVCGDKIVDPGEECDDNNTVSGDGCSALCTLESTCGDGVTEGAEACDPGDPNAPLGCRANCTIAKCGDGVVDTIAKVPEQCDDGISNNVYPAPCSTACTINSFCGDGVIQGVEECDDGSSNGKTGSVCSFGCELLGACGNGVKESSEECDASALLSGQCGGNTCNRDTCICENYCGDGRVGGLEECDDGNRNALDACRGPEQTDASLRCTAVRCGDGKVDPQVFTGHPAEQCDDGNNLPGDGCTNDCKLFVICGDGTTTSPEQCDDGNNFSGDGCSSACKDETVICGDEKQMFPEECDDGIRNGTEASSCTTLCRKKLANCGNGVLETNLNEQCDDSNRIDGDGCDIDCHFEGCGDGVIVPGEQCDDRNRISGDGCSATCQVEIQ